MAAQIALLLAAVCYAGAAIFGRAFKDLDPMAPAVDKLVAAGELPNDALLLSALLQSPAEEYMDGERDPALAFDAFAEEMALRFPVPRRIRERLRLLLAVQKRCARAK